MRINLNYGILIGWLSYIPIAFFGAKDNKEIFMSAKTGAPNIRKSRDEDAHTGVEGRSDLSPRENFPHPNSPQGLKP
jgi:hypothetical protein